MSDNAVPIDVIGKSKIKSFSQNEKIERIIRSVQDGNVVILQTGLTPEEKSSLVERVMAVVEPNEFGGIDIESIDNGQDKEKSGGLFNRFLGSNDNSPSDTAVVIAPAERIETLKKEDDTMKALIRQE